MMSKEFLAVFGHDQANKDANNNRIMDGEASEIMHKHQIGLPRLIASRSPPHRSSAEFLLRPIKSWKSDEKSEPEKRAERRGS